MNTSSVHGKSVKSVVTLYSNIHQQRTFHGRKRVKCFYFPAQSVPTRVRKWMTIEAYVNIVCNSFCSLRWARAYVRYAGQDPLESSTMPLIMRTEK